MSAIDDFALPEPQSAKFKNSFAYVSVQHRAPQILTKTIDSLHRRNGEIRTKYGEEGLNQLNSAISVMSQLRYEMMTNKPLREFPEGADISSTDIPLWNEWLRKKKTSFPDGFAWFTGPWLDVECFLYRAAYEAFRIHPLIKDIDPYGEPKLDNLTASAESSERLISWYEANMLADGKHTSKDKDFDILLQLSLWGNRCDLSHSSGTTSAASATNLSPIEEIEHLRPWLLVDHSSRVWKWLTSDSSNPIPRQIDVVIDNSGFELITDLLIVDWLLHQVDGSGAFLFSPVVMHCKAFPWFMSDTTVADFDFTLDWLSDKMYSRNLVSRLRTMFATRRLVLKNEPFWTTPYSFWYLGEIAPELLTELRSSRLVIFKGDLNGRKMFNDLRWAPTVPFHEAIAPLAKLFDCDKTNGGTALCLARTLKCEVDIGLTAEVVERLNKESNDWASNGKYGEIQAVVPPMGK